METHNANGEGCNTLQHVTVTVTLPLTPENRSRWKQVGATQALTSDSDIASFLLNLYEKTLSQTCVAVPCQHCQRDNMIMTASLTSLLMGEQSVPGSARGATGEEQGENDKEQTGLHQEDHGLHVHFENQLEETTQSSGHENDSQVIPSTSFCRGLPPSKRLSSNEEQSKCHANEASQRTGAEHEPQDGLQFTVMKLGKSKPKDKAILCPTCGVRLSQEKNLMDHLRIHTGEKPFICSLCGRGFSQDSSLRRHVKRHSNFATISVACPFCNSLFSSNGDLEDHVKLCRDNAGYLCMVCNQSFVTLSSLEIHSASHSANEQRVSGGQTCDQKTTALSPQQGEPCIKQAPSTSDSPVNAQLLSAETQALEYPVLFEAEEEDTDPINRQLLEGIEQICQSQTDTHTQGQEKLQPFVNWSERNAVFPGRAAGTLGSQSTGLCFERHDPSPTLQQDDSQDSDGDRNPQQDDPSLSMGDSSGTVYSQRKSGKKTTGARQGKTSKSTGRKKVSATCMECGTQLSRASDLKVHMRIHTGEKPFQCTQCLRAFNQKSSLNTHMRLHSGDKVFISRSNRPGPAKVKSVARKTRKPRQKEMKTEDDQEGDVDQLPVASLSENQAEDKLGQGRDYEDQCQEVRYQDEPGSLTADDNLSPHAPGPSVRASDEGLPEDDTMTKRKRPGRPPSNKSACVDCPECGLTLSGRRSLKFHMRLHTGEKPHLCNECGQEFRQAGSLTAHMRKHRNERPYVCHVCAASFPLLGSLNVHLQTHSTVKPFACEECSRAFSRASELKVHMARHFGLRNYACTLCDQSFVTSSELTRHTRLHTGEKPYVCTVCQKGFRLKKTLTEHVRTHSKDKPYTCATCGKSFAHVSTYTTHCRLHTGVKPYQCPQCPVAFPAYANLTQHLWYKHKTKLATIK